MSDQPRDIAWTRLDAYWASIGAWPVYEFLTDLAWRLNENQSAYDLERTDDWKELLESTLRELGYTVIYEGERIQTLTFVGIT